MNKGVYKISKIKLKIAMKIAKGGSAKQISVAMRNRSMLNFKAPFLEIMPRGMGLDGEFI